MEKFLIYILVIFLIACTNAENQKSNNEPESIDSISYFNVLDSVFKIQSKNTSFDSTGCGLNFDKGIDYQNSKNHVNKLKLSLSKNYKELNDSIEKVTFLDSIMISFTAKLLNEIIPFWYGTEWDFDGYTSKPNDGKVACGYFVSTTLRDMGLNLNRYRLAQQCPENEAKTIAILENNLKSFDIANFNSISELLLEINDGLYFIGLDYHVGYLFKNETANYFIHSNYIDGMVMVEVAEYSEAFKSKNYYLAEISSNRELALKWIQNSEITIIE